MIDIKRIREKPDEFKKACKDKNFKADIEYLLEIDADLQDKKKKLQYIATEKNRLGKSIPKLFRDEKNSAIGKLSVHKKNEAMIQKEIKELQPELDALLLQVPQPADADVPTGKDDTENIELRRWGKNSRI